MRVGVGVIHAPGRPLGTLANDLGEWRQYVRDPQGLFDDGFKLYAAYSMDASLPPMRSTPATTEVPGSSGVSSSQAAEAVFVVNSGHRRRRTMGPVLQAHPLPMMRFNRLPPTHQQEGRQWLTRRRSCSSRKGHRADEQLRRHRATS